MNKQNEPIIAFDESGNSGSNLLIKAQPVFILASVKLTLEQATELKELFKTNATELKFTKLKKYRKYHPQILALLNHDFITRETVGAQIYLCKQKNKPLSMLIVLCSDNINFKTMTQTGYAQPALPTEF